MWRICLRVLVGIIVTINVYINIISLHQAYPGHVQQPSMGWPVPLGSQPVVICFATTATQQTQEMIHSLTMHGWLYVIPIGLGAEWAGFATKSSSVLAAALRIGATQPQRLVVVADVYDVLFNGGPAAAVEAYSKLRCGVVVAAEARCGSNCHPTARRRCGGDHNINGGFVMGTAVDVAKLYSDILHEAAYDDQMAMGRLWEDDCSRMCLDTAGVLMRAVYPGQERSYTLTPGGWQDGCVTPTAFHMTFQAIDGGARRNMLGPGCTPIYKPLTTGTGAHIQAVARHLFIHAPNPAYAAIRNKISLAVCLVLVIASVTRFKSAWGGTWR